MLGVCSRERGVLKMHLRNGIPDSQTLHFGGIVMQEFLLFGSVQKCKANNFSLLMKIDVCGEVRGLHVSLFLLKIFIQFAPRQFLTTYTGKRGKFLRN